MKSTMKRLAEQAGWDMGDEVCGFSTGGLAAGDKYLNEGRLYAVKFNSDGVTGRPRSDTICITKIDGGVIGL